MSTESKIPVGDTGKDLRTVEQTTGAGLVHTEAVFLADPDTPANRAGVTSDGDVQVTLAGETVAVTGGLTDAEMRASPVAVDTGLTQPTTPTDTQPVSAASLPLPTGAATAANQLPDNHQVTVSNQIDQPLEDGGTVVVDNFPSEYPLPAAQVSTLTPQTDALTDAELRASPVSVENLTQLVPEQYDEIGLSYTGDDLTEVVYKNATVTVATLTLGYTSGKLTSVVRS